MTLKRACELGGALSLSGTIDSGRRDKNNVAHSQTARKGAKRICRDDLGTSPMSYALQWPHIRAEHPRPEQSGGELSEHGVTWHESYPPPPEVPTAEQWIKC